jgi:pimeloyl-ACP methyl ester carboxylesterase
MTRRLLATLAVLVLAPAGLLRADEAGLKKPYFDSNGVKIHYVVQGKEDGEPAVLIHGFSSSIESNWAPVIKALSKDYKVIALDCRGHGGSQKPHDAKKYGLEMVEDVVRLLDHLKIKKAHIVGYSMGASLTLQVAARHPERVRTAVLGGNGLTAPGSDKFFIALADSLEQGKGMGPLIDFLTPKGRPKATAEQIKLINERILARNDAKALGAVMRGMASKDFQLSTDLVKAIKVPMVAIVGALDPLKARVDALKELRPDLPVVVIPDADHIAPLGREEFVNGVKDFLDRHCAGARRAPAVSR